MPLVAGLGAAPLRGLPIRARIAIFGGAVVLLAVVVFGGLVDLLFERSVYASQDQSLQARSAQLARPPGSRGAPRNFAFARRTDGSRNQVPVDLRSSGDTFTEFLDADGAPGFTSGEIDVHAPRVPAAILRRARQDGEALATIHDSGVELRLSVRPLAAPPGLPGGAATAPTYVVVGQSAGRILAEVAQLRLYLLLAAILSLLGALVASWVVAGRALRPLDHMTATVEAIGSASDLPRRLPAAPARDEVGRLTDAFNGMMGRLDDAYGRLEGALESQRRFVADASHELRTPLTTIRTNLGLLLGRHEVEARDRQEALRDMQGEAERMSRLVQDLLTLARADAGQALEMEPTDAGQLVEEVCRNARRTYPAHEFHLEEKAVPTITANADSLRQLLWILVDNAVRHGPAGGRVDFSVGVSAGRLVLAVADDGPGIDPAERERVFERFYRADPARASGGAGLGLSIARWIVEQHRGQVEVGSNPAGSGARFTVRLPLATPNSPAPEPT